MIIRCRNKKNIKFEKKIESLKWKKLEKIIKKQNNKKKEKI